MGLVRHLWHPILPYLPATIAFLLVIPAAGNWKIFGGSSIVPLTTCMMTCYWAIYSPQHLPKLAVFLLGLWYDLLLAQPVGSSSLLLLLMWWIVVRQREMLMLQHFWVIWLVFAIVQTIYLLMQWALYSLYFLRLMEWEHAVMQWGMTILLYPLIHGLCHPILYQLADREE